MGALACDDDPSPPTGDTACGSGPVQISLGVGQPFMPLPDQIFEVEAGLQGGFHIDISVRAEGALDPDLVDIDLVLRQGERWALSRHVTAEWLLFVLPEGPWCDYPRARMVLLDEEGGLLPRARLSEVDDVPLTLEVTLDSAAGRGEAQLPVRLRVPPSLL